MSTMIVEYSKTEAALAELAARFAGVTFDLSTTAGMKSAKEARAELRGYRTDLERVRKEIKAPALQRCQDIDAEAKRITSALLSLEEPIDEQIKAEEQRKAAEKAAAEEAERARIEAIQVKIRQIADTPARLASAGSMQIAEAQASLTMLSPDIEEFAEFTAQAVAARAEALTLMVAMYEKAVAAEEEKKRIEEERAELARIKAEMAERERAEREAKAKQDELARVVREQQEAEARRLEQERAELERQRKAFEAAQASATKTEPEATVKESLPVQAEAPKVATVSTIPVAAPRPFRPTDMQIIDAVAEVFEARHETVIEWIACMDLERASKELALAI